MSLAGMVKKIMPISRSKDSKPSSESGEMNVEYSVALEYKGPVLEHSIPQAVPLDFDRIPTAKVGTPAAVMADLAWPVVQPISRRRKMQNEDSSIRFRCKDAEEVSGEMISSSRVSGELLVQTLDATESSGTLGFSDSRDHSNELSGSSDMGETPLHCENVKDLKRYMDIASSSDPQAFSVEVSSSCEEVSDEEGLQRPGRTANVTFVEPDSNGMIYEDEEEEDEMWDSMSDVQPAVRMRRQLPERVVKKGLCFRCHKGSRFTEKEVCIVCDAKYCSTCVLRAMGSMPEGRKCLLCLGYPIDESKRKYLGRCSRMLRRLLSEDGVKLIMHSEVYCAANQIPSELIVVNGKSLSEEELNLLLNCPVPPRKLKPGRYWYDKVSGFWGKEGCKPCEIITDDLNVGDRIQPDASNGNKAPLINGRKITRAERWMLKFAGVQVDAIPSLWLEADGSFQEEGMGNVKDSIWSKKRTKVLCSLLSLPTPDSSRSSGIMPNHRGEGDIDQCSLHKLLLLGNHQSGTSTIFKQARVAYNVQLSEEERESLKSMIQSKMYGYLAVLLEGRELFEEECLEEMRKQAAEQPGPSDYMDKEVGKTVYSIGTKLGKFSDWLVKIMVSGNLDVIFPAATREYAPYVEELWKDPAIQATYSRLDELQLPRVANYILNKAVEIAKVDYEPSETDILCTEGINSSNGLAQFEFSFPQSAEVNNFTDHDELPNSLKRYQLIRLTTPNLGPALKHVPMLDPSSLVFFCVPLTAYSSPDQMSSHKSLFQTLISHPTFAHTPFLLLLTKFDLFEESLDHTPLTHCPWFADFNPVLSRHPPARSANTASVADRAFHYVAVKFKRLFREVTGRNLYVWKTTALEMDMVDGAVRYAREVVKWEEEKGWLGLGFGDGLNEASSESMEASTL